MSNPPSLAAAVDAVLNVHERIPYPWYPEKGDVCGYCYNLNWSQEGLDDSPEEYMWPCTTVRVMQQALGVDHE